MSRPLRVLVVLFAAIIALGSGFAVFAKEPGPGKDRPGHVQQAPSIVPLGAPTIPLQVQEPLGPGAMNNAQAIATEFGISTDEIINLREHGVGFGAVVKILLLAQAKGVSAESLASSLNDENGQGPGLGKAFKDLSEGEAARIEGLPKNLGQLKKAQVQAEAKGNKKR